MITAAEALDIAKHNEATAVSEADQVSTYLAEIEAAIESAALRGKTQVILRQFGHWLACLEPDELAAAQVINSLTARGFTVQGWNLCTPGRGPMLVPAMQIRWSTPAPEPVTDHDQWHAWRIGRDSKDAGATSDEALARLWGCFPQPEMRKFFDAGFAGHKCPELTAPRVE